MKLDHDNWFELLRILINFSFPAVVGVANYTDKYGCIACKMLSGKSDILHNFLRVVSKTDLEQTIQVYLNVMTMLFSHVSVNKSLHFNCYVGYIYCRITAPN